jgi:HK97 family phage portal protein
MGHLARLVIPERKFTLADAGVNWTRINTLVHGPGAYAAPAHGDGNSAVFACLRALAVGGVEAPLRVYQRDADGKAEALHDHPWQALLDKPTPKGELSPAQLWFWTQWVKHIDGNAYWRKVRAGNPESGNVVQLWPISPSVMEPVTVKGSGDFISYYKQQTAPGIFEPVAVENVVHFRLGIDDQDHRRGVSPLKRLVRSVSTDDEADRYVEVLLRNYAVPGLVVRTADKLSKEQADAYKDRLANNFGSDKRGNVAVMSKNDEISQFGFSPSDLDMSILHRIPEERISAVLGVPAIVAGLGAGLDRATYANFREAREMFTEQTLMPLWSFDAATLNMQLKPDFASDPSIYCEFDVSDVRAFQEDEDAKWKRVDLGVVHGWVTPDEARADVKLPPLADGSGATIKPPAPAFGQQPPQLQPSGQNGAQQDGQPSQNGKAVQLKASDLLAQWPGLIAAMQELARPALESDLGSYFEGQRRRVRRNLTGQEEG